MKLDLGKNWFLSNDSFLTPINYIRVIIIGYNYYMYVLEKMSLLIFFLIIQYN